MRLPSLVLALLPVLAAGCGGSSDPAELSSSGTKALAAGDFAGARADFDAAVAAIGNDPANPDFKRAKLGAIEARTKDAPDEAVRMFLELAKAHPESIDDGEFNRIASRLGAEGHFTEAIELVKAGQERYPESPHLAKLVQTLGDKAKASGAGNDVLENLKGLGYAGGD